MRVVPADEGLDADDLGRPEIDVGLVDEEELVVLEGVDQIGIEILLARRPDGRGPSTSEPAYIWNALRPRSLARYMASSARLSSSS